MIHSVGDSHARCSFAGIPEVVTHEIGPITMESVGKPRPGISSSEMLDMIIENQGITEQDTVILCFGEIDIRSKIQPRIEAGEKEDFIIGQITYDYMMTVACSKYKNKMILSITPSASSAEQWNNPSFPFLGTDKDRARFTKKMNEHLRKQCKEINIPFLDVYDNYKDENGMIIPSLSDGSVHIGNTSFVKEALLNRS
jgi:hypothetical protein